MTERAWVVYEVTEDPRREIGSMPTRRVEWEQMVDFDPLARIAELEAALRLIADEDFHDETTRYALLVLNETDE